MLVPPTAVQKSAKMTTELESRTPINRAKKSKIQHSTHYTYNSMILKYTRFRVGVVVWLYRGEIKKGKIISHARSNTPVEAESSEL